MLIEQWYMLCCLNDDAYFCRDYYEIDCSLGHNCNIVRGSPSTSLVWQDGRAAGATKARTFAQMQADNLVKNG